MADKKPKKGAEKDAAGLIAELGAKKAKLRRLIAEADEVSGIVRTLADVANHFGVSTRYVANWRERGCPGFAVGAYDLSQITEWREENIETNERNSEASDDARQQKLLAEARLATLKAAEKEGELIGWRDVSEIIEAYIAEAKTQLEQLPERLLTKFTPPRGKKKELVQILRQEIHDILNDLAGVQDELADKRERIQS